GYEIPKPNFFFVYKSHPSPSAMVSPLRDERRSGKHGPCATRLPHDHDDFRVSHPFAYMLNLVFERRNAKRDDDADPGRESQSYGDTSNGDKGARSPSCPTAAVSRAG